MDFRAEFFNALPRRISGPQSGGFGSATGNLALSTSQTNRAPFVNG